MLKEILRKLERYFVDEQYQESGERRRVLLTFYLNLTGGLATLILPFVYVAIGFNKGLYFSTFATFLVVIMLIMMRKGVSQVFIGNFCAFSVILDLGALVVFTGGIDSPALIWLLFAPITGYLLTNDLSGKIWSGITFGLILVLGFLIPDSVELPSLIPQEYFRMVHGINFILSVSILLIIVFSYESNQVNAVKEMDQLNSELRRKTREKEELNKNLEGIVEERTRELKRMNEELDHFSYSISHNLRAPLTSILGLVELAEKEPENLDKYLGMIRKSTSKLDQTIHGINSYLRNYRGEVELEDLNIKSLLEEIINDQAFSKEARKMDIELKVSQDLNIKSDRERLRTIFSNLLSNSVKYSDEEKEKNFITLSSRANGNSCYVEVEDNGIGISKEKQGKVFNMFYRGTERSKGDGLGLYIVNETLIKLGGSVKLESNEGEGTKFVVQIPS